jgi:hypothetical protein
MQVGEHSEQCGSAFLSESEKMPGSQPAPNYFFKFLIIFLNF